MMNCVVELELRFTCMIKYIHPAPFVGPKPAKRFDNILEFI